MPPVQTVSYVPGPYPGKHPPSPPCLLSDVAVQPDAFKPARKPYNLLGALQGHFEGYEL
jgi:hypothetical protein